MTGTSYFYRKNASTIVRRHAHSIESLEKETKTFLPLTQPEVVQELDFQFQATSFTESDGVGFARVSTSTATAINEETEATVAAYARFDDIGGNAAASTSTFDGTMLRVPLEDNEGRTAYYHGHWKYIDWSAHKVSDMPSLAHQRTFMLSNAVELNVPGNDALDQEGFVYYDTHANFNITASTSVSLWFYPTNITQIAGETWRHLLYRRIDASNHYAILIKPADSKIYVFVNEAGVTTKRVTTNTVNLNAWNLIIFTYDPATNALVTYLNNSTAGSSPADTYTAPYTVDANMYLGGLPNLPAKRYTGYMDNFVFWTAKILTGTEAGNMWTKGTIV